MQQTLATLKLEVGLDGSEMFGPDLQDRLGYELLKRRHYADFMAHKLPLTTFANGLRCPSSWPAVARTRDRGAPVLLCR